MFISSSKHVPRALAKTAFKTCFIVAAAVGLVGAEDRDVRGHEAVLADILDCQIPAFRNCGYVDQFMSLTLSVVLFPRLEEDGGLQRIIGVAQLLDLLVISA